LPLRHRRQSRESRRLWSAPRSVVHNASESPFRIWRQGPESARVEFRTVRSDSSVLNQAGGFVGSRTPSHAECSGDLVGNGTIREGRSCRPATNTYWHKVAKAAYQESASSRNSSGSQSSCAVATF